MKLKGIIVDDEENSRKLLSKRVPGWMSNIEIVDVCCDAKDAIISLMRHKPDFMLLDINMPGMDGLEFFKHVKELGINVQCIVITGNTEVPYFQEAIRLGLTDYLLKPVMENEFRKAIDNVISKISSRQQAANNREPQRENNKFNLPITNGALRVSSEQVLYAEANGKYTDLYFTSGIKETILLGISDLENIITGEQIIRIDRFMIINFHHLQKVSVAFNKVYFLIEQKTIELSISKTGADKTLELLKVKK